MRGEMVVCKAGDEVGNESECGGMCRFGRDESCETVVIKFERVRFNGKLLMLHRDVVCRWMIIASAVDKMRTRVIG